MSLRAVLRHWVGTCVSCAQVPRMQRMEAVTALTGALWQCAAHQDATQYLGIHGAARAVYGGRWEVGPTRRP